MQPYEQLEHDYAEFCGRHPEVMVACSSGSAALHLAFLSLRNMGLLGNGDYVTVPDFSMIACPRAVAATPGLIPKFVDVDLATANLSDKILSKCSTESALLLVHTYGRKAEIDCADDIIVEDLAEAHGIQPREDSIACWSFYKNKVIAGEEGGMVAFQTKDQADIARCLRSLGTEDYSYRAIPFGFNYRMSNVHAELISISLEHFKYNLLGRKSIEGLYDQYIPTDWKRSTREIPWVYDFMLPDGIDVLKLMQTLHKNNVPVRVGFRPNHSQPEWYCTNTFPVTEQLASRLMYLPIDPLSLTTKMIRKWTRELIIEVEEQLG